MNAISWCSIYRVCLLARIFFYLFWFQGLVPGDGMPNPTAFSIWCTGDDITFLAHCFDQADEEV